MSALVNPIGDFPLNDDWRYALGVKSILQTGRFELPTPEAPNVFAQAYWGALFCLPFGFSFTALRFSTLTLGGVGVCAFYLLLREIGGNRWTALLGGLTLAVNPLYFGLSHTFMTDVPSVALVIAALWLFVRGFRREEPVSLLAGILLVLLTILIRQFALLLLLAFGIAYVMRKGATWKALVVATVPLVVGIGLHFSYQHWMVATGRTPFFELASFNLPTPLGLFVGYSLRYIIIALPYLGFFVAPFLASVALSGSYADGRNRRLLICLLVVVLAGAVLGVLYTRVYTPLPEIGHILSPAGLGAHTLRGIFFLRQDSTIFWIGSIVLGALGGAGILLYLGHAATQVANGLRRPECRAANWLLVLALVLVGAYATLLLPVGFSLQTPLFDRYLLFFVPVILVLVVTKEICSGYIPAPRWRRVVSLALAFAYATVVVAATHDYLAWNRTRWMATRTLIEAGVLPRQIDGGYEFNGWHLFDLHYQRKPNKSYWWVDDDEYVVAAGPLNGYRELQRFSFPHWLFFADVSVVVLHRVDLEIP